MPEEQEFPSLSENTFDETENNDDTIKILRVKLPLNGYNALQITSDKDVDGLGAQKLSLPANGNREADEAVRLKLSLPMSGNGHATGDNESDNGNESGAMNCASTVLDGQYETGNAHTTEESIDDANELHIPHFASIEHEDVTSSLPSSLSSSVQTRPTQPVARPRNVSAPLRPIARLWNFSRLLCVALLLLPIIALCMYAYIQLNHSQSNLYTVDAHSGTILWQQPATGAAQMGLVNAQGSVQIVTLATNEQQLIALDSHGRVQWQSFTSNGAFALPSIHSASGTVLATLSEQTATGHSLTLYSFNQATGHINWQYDITQPAQAQTTDILGVDTNFIYALSSQPLVGQQTQVQLLAINQYTGYIGWRVNSPPEADGNPLDKGALLLTGHALVWQVNATIQVIDATQGSILWAAFLPFSNINTAQQDEAQMTVVHGQLVVERDDVLHSFDMTTGKKLWNMSVFDFSTGTIPASIATTGQMLLVYGNGQLEAISVSYQHVIWQQRQMGNILGFHVSDDGTLVYIILLDSVENSTPAQALIAFDAQNGAARWTFQPSDQFTFLNPQSDGFQYRQHTILTTICVTSTCNHPHLYALNAATGATLWKFEGNGISNPLMSFDGNIVSYEGHTSPWQQFIQGLSG